MSERQTVIDLQEIRLARVAARSMRVGALWYAHAPVNPTLVNPLELLDAGFLFLKRSLLGVSSDYIDRERVLEWLEHNHHPIDPALRVADERVVH